MDHCHLVDWSVKSVYKGWTYCCDRKSRAAYAQSFALHTMTNLLLLVRATYTVYIFVLRAHHVRGESHNQRNTTGEVATVP